MANLVDCSVGDRLFVTEMYGSGGSIHKVQRLTPTQVECGYWKFRKEDGRQVGATGYGVRFARPATEGDILYIRIKIATKKLREITITAETVDAAEELIKLARSPETD